MSHYSESPAAPRGTPQWISAHRPQDRRAPPAGWRSSEAMASYRALDDPVG
jgi:hypothetical protein